MRIAVDIRPLMEGKTTGVEVYLINLLDNLFKLDNRNEYILFANSFRKIDLPEFKYPNVKTVVTRYPNKLFNFFQKLGFPKIEKIVGGIDLFFSPHWRVLAIKKSTRLVVTFHDLFFEIMPDFFTWRRRIWHWFMNYKGAAVRADKIIAVSENTKRDLAEIYGIAKEKIEVVYPGVHNSPQPSLTLREGVPPLKVRGGEGELYFLYFGTFEPRKNIETVLAAYEQYYKDSEVKRPLILAGSHGWKTNIMIPVQLKNKITVRLNVTEQEKRQLYQNAFAFIFPSYYEGFGFPILEAASYSLPVIASYNSSLAEIGRDFVFFANPFRPSGFARAMLDLEQDNGLYADFAGKGYQAASNFKWQIAAEKTLRLFQETAI